MAVTRLTDVIVPEIFNDYMSKNTKQVMAFFQTGVLRADADLANKLAGGGRTFNVPFWRDLADTESDTATDDPASFATPDNVTAGNDVALRQVRTHGWSTAHLTAELAGSDPMERIGNRVGAYWGRQFDTMAISTARGVFADNIANDGGDMVHSVYEDVVTPTAGAFFTTESLMDAAQTMGDAKRDLNLIVMHSVIQTQLAKNDLIDFRPDSESDAWIPFFQGYRVHVSDRLPVVAGTNQPAYHTYLFGSNAMAFAEHDVAVPVEVDPEPSAADGMGVETLWTRRQLVIHPYGIRWTDTTVASTFPTNAELQLAANWDRVYPERKQIPMALLITNG